MIVISYKIRRFLSEDVEYAVRLTDKENWGYVDARIRLEQFRDAIARVIRPGSSVADLGCAWVDVLRI